jgi:predicted dehydrogenase
MKNGVSSANEGKNVPSLALVGCGAIADAFHLPALTRRAELLGKLIVVDADPARAEAVRARVGAAEAVSDHRAVLSRVRGAIIATPHRLHHPITLDFVRAGAHVLCEKPLAESAEQVDELTAAASKAGVHVAVNHTMRLYSTHREVARLTSSGELGEVREIHYELGDNFQWPATSNTYFGTKAGGRGVLFDTGAHVIDLVCWWLGGEPEIEDYADDSRGGTEAVARIVLRRGATVAQVRLSWLSKLRNQYRVIGTRGSIEGAVYEWSAFTRRNASGASRRVKTDRARTFDDFADQLLSNFVDVIERGAQPLIGSADTRASIAVINGCYARRSPFAEPWHEACEELAHV